MPKKPKEVKNALKWYLNCKCFPYVSVIIPFE